ncbi:hypothetical protein [Luteolibacter soli]|uniref:Zinc resistance-associated protein n=1 Tax=Luteolibacter soli TaxID=3135280 RepID=A0ABU9B0Z0_9BACT
MKPSFRDHLVILLALATVFACGFGVGQIQGKKASAPKPEVSAHWEEETLSLLKHSLDLAPQEQVSVEREIQRAATRIRLKRDETILSYHEQISELYGRLIEELDGPNAAKLKKEKQSLDEKIQKLRPQT